MISLIETLIHHAECKLGYSLQLGFNIIDDIQEFPKKRNCAYTDGENIYFSSKMLSLPIENQIAVIAHEIAHCDLIQRNIKHTEKEADKYAEEIFYIDISYDQDDIQTTSTGKKIRPSYLPQ